jgi:hypothetical protein
MFGSRECGRTDCGRRESTETKIFPPFGSFVREERKLNFCGSHCLKPFRPGLERKQKMEIQFAKKTKLPLVLKCFLQDVTLHQYQYYSFFFFQFIAYIKSRFIYLFLLKDLFFVIKILELQKSRLLF